jgi:hypothetical protein
MSNTLLLKSSSILTPLCFLLFRLQSEYDKVVNMILTSMAPGTVVVIILKRDRSKTWGEDEWTRRLKPYFSVINNKTVEYKVPRRRDPPLRSGQSHHVRLLGLVR